MLWFASFCLDLADERLWRAGEEVHLRRKPFAILCHLAQHPGRLVTQQELVDAVWGRIATSESLLRTHIRLLRQVVGDGIIQTVVGRGYLPIFAALDRACRKAEGVRALDALNQHAPTWLAQMPGLLAQGRAEELQRRVAWTTQARMLRELAQAIEAMSAQRPVVLALDDLQWSDHSTVEALTMIARRLQPARLLILGSYRPAELAKAHPLTKAIGELVAHKQAAELPLQGFCEAGVAEFLERRFPGHAFPASLVPTAWGMTGGNPLFLVTLFDDLENTGTIRLVDGRWLLETGVEVPRPDLSARVGGETSSVSSSRRTRKGAERPRQREWFERAVAVMSRAARAPPNRRRVEDEAAANPNRAPARARAARPKPCGR